MSFFDQFRKQKNPARRTETDFNPTAHHILLEYLRKSWAGVPSDPIFEQKSLSGDLHFNLLNFAEVILSLCKERDIAVDKVADFLNCGIPGGGDSELANLLQRIAILADGGFSEQQRSELLTSGIVGDPSEITAITPQFDSVGFVIKYCRAIESLKNDEIFGERKGGEVELPEDPGWK